MSAIVTHRLDAAEFIAKVEIREDTGGNVRDAERASQGLAEVLNSAPDAEFDNLVTDLVRRLGRDRALAVQFDLETVDAVLA